jgi:uncharacterized membrane protein YidH (DUF202 family)
MADEPNKPTEDFATAKWRPFMGWTYMAICFFDFVIGPIMNVAFSIITKTPLVAWKSLTLDNGGLFHLAMGAVLGVAAYGRTQEKVAKIDNGIPLPGSPTPSVSTPDPTPVVSAPVVIVNTDPIPASTTRKRFS